MKRLKELRKQHGMTQQSVAGFLDITNQAYSNYENGNRQPDFSTLKKLSELFKVSIDYLLENSDNTAIVGGPDDKISEKARYLARKYDDDPKMQVFIDSFMESYDKHKT